MTETTASRRSSIPFYATTQRRSRIIILAVDAHVYDDLDRYVAQYVEKGFSVVVLVGNRFHVEPLLPGMPLPEVAGKVSAQPAWAWCADNLPFARDVVFVG